MTHARIPRIHSRTDDYGVGATSAVDLKRVAAERAPAIFGPYRARRPIRNALLHDLHAALRAAVAEFRRCRWLRAGGCPDRSPF